MPDIFIELDRDLDLLEEPPPRPSRFGKRWRPWAAAGAVLVLLSTLGSAGSRPVASIQLVAQFEVHDATRLEVIGDSLLVAEPDRLTSYVMGSGQRRWQVQTGLSDVFLARDDDMVILNGTLGPAKMNLPPPQASMAVDIATGEVRWRITGYIDVLEDALIAYQYSGPSEVPDQLNESGITVYSRDGRRALWSTPQSRVGPAVNVERSIVTTLDRETGELTDHKLHTGEVINRYTFPELIGANGFFYDRGRAVFFFDDGRQLSFDGITLHPNPDSMHDLRQDPIDCGQVWCNYKADGPGYFMIDKASGKKVYEASDWDIIVRTEIGLLGIRYPQGDGPMRALGMFEPRTGKELEVKGWSLLDLAFNDPLPVISKGPIYLWSYQNTLDYFGILKADGVRTLGVLAHTDELRQCTVAAPNVACLVGSNLVRIWRLT
ncbi:hypothetical protein Rhe02_91400 [Rhizocola hellebori]|uniref:Uncharacterized protein n=1 Tax=Rhizocola hellebori TaxID=1392758 RepID=A0A8J3QHN1_9ACTN|nr:hypothetical protein [Rhizocola hellebori]GIH11073.1 hypothetical protein Rhe02_91400 [Rhizocola hellebori]